MDGSSTGLQARPQQDIGPWAALGGRGSKTSPVGLEPALVGSAQGPHLDPLPQLTPGPLSLCGRAAKSCVHTCSSQPARQLTVVRAQADPEAPGGKEQGKGVSQSQEWVPLRRKRALL